MKNAKSLIIKITIFVSILVLLSLVGTLASWIWRSEVNKDVVFNTSKEIQEYIVYDTGDSKFVGNFQPTDTFCNGQYTTISFYKTEEAADIPLYATINMDINSIGSNISASNDVYWVLTEGDSSITCDNGLETTDVIEYGNFNYLGGETITLKSDIKITTSKQQFTVWIWLDSNSSDLSSLSGETLDVNIWTQIDMIPNENLNQNKPNAPVLDNGMIPVAIDNNGTVTVANENNTDWYDYENKEWANAVLVKEQGTKTRSYYKNNPGKIVNQDDILAYYVWIPRYKYKMQESCYEIPEKDRNPEDYPECYAPYSMSEPDKEKLAVYTLCPGYSESEKEEALESVNNALQTGKFVDPVVIEINNDYIDYYLITSVVELYNNGRPNVGCFGDGSVPDGSKLTLNLSSFNGNPVANRKDNERPINIIFETADAALSKGDAEATYYTHPAFWWDDNNNGVVNNGETIAGIWVGKFETTPDKSSSCYNEVSEANCNNTTQNPTILPNEQPLVYQTIGNQFTTSQNLSKIGNIYGLSHNITDGHMMKNRDWGAVLYLSHSVYGINTEITQNNYNYYDDITDEYKTGCGFGTVSAGSVLSETCGNAYGTDGIVEYSQSTTGNITGVFDMSGGATEYVMGNYDNQTNEYLMTLPDSKYYDVYLANQFNGDWDTNLSLCTLETCGGHALHETLNWYGSILSFVNLNELWFMRGDSAGYGNAFDAFADGGFGAGNGQGLGWISWRSALVVKNNN